MEETKRSGMGKDEFWSLIEKAKEVCGTDLEASAVWIKQQLFYKTAEDGLRVVIRKTLRTSVSGGRPAARL